MPNTFIVSLISLWFPLSTALQPYSGPQQPQGITGNLAKEGQQQQPSAPLSEGSITLNINQADNNKNLGQVFIYDSPHQVRFYLQLKNLESEAQYRMALLEKSECVTGEKRQKNSEIEKLEIENGPIKVKENVIHELGRYSSDKKGELSRILHEPILTLTQQQQSRIDITETSLFIYRYDSQAGAWEVLACASLLN